MSEDTYGPRHYDQQAAHSCAGVEVRVKPQQNMSVGVAALVPRAIIGIASILLFASTISRSVAAEGAGSRDSSVVYGKFASLLKEEKMAECRTECAEWLNAERMKHQEGDIAIAVEQLTDDKAFSAIVTVHEILRQCDTNFFNAFNHLPDSDVFIDLMFSNADWFADLIAYQPEGKVSSGSIYTLYSIWKMHPEAATHPVYRKMSVAFAQRGGGVFKYGETRQAVLVHKYLTYRDIHQDGRMHGDYDSYSPYKITETITKFRRLYDIQHLSRLVNWPRGQYTKACWLAPNRKKSIFAYPNVDWFWRHEYTESENVRNVGGVCGTISTYGVQVCRAHGIPASTAGEPGHCSHVINTQGEQWRVNYHVRGPTKPYTLWKNKMGYLGVKEVAFRDPESLLRGMKTMWFAHMVDAQSRAPGAQPGLFSADAKKLYQQALLSLNAHYGHWNWYANTLSTRGDTDFETWKWAINNGTASFYDHGCGEPGDDFLKSWIGKLKTDSNAALTSALVELQDLNLRSGNVALLMSQLSDKADQFRFFKEIVELYSTRNPGQLETVLALGKDFSEDSDLASEYRVLISSHATAGCDAALLKRLKQLVLDSAQDENLYEWNKFTTQAATHYKDEAKQLSELLLNDAQLKQHPVLPKASGTLLSDEGVLQLSSSHHAHDRPLLGHRLALRTGRLPGWLHTEEEEQPSATVALTATCPITQFQLVPRYENNKWTYFPLVVQVSADGEAWDTMETITEYKPFYAFDWSADSPEAKYIRVLGDYMGAKKALQLRRMLVYGITRY